MLTEAGQAAVVRVQGVLALYDGIPGELGGHGLAGRLRLGAIQTALVELLPNALAALREAHPRLRVQVASGMSAELILRWFRGHPGARFELEVFDG